MSLLTLVQRHCRVNGLNYPTSVVGSADSTVLQLWGILDELVDLISDQSNFQGFTRQALFNLTASESQGQMSMLADEGYLWMRPGTFWDRSRHMEMQGPLSDEAWQVLKAFNSTGTLYSFRLLQNELFIFPTPEPTGLSEVAFEYSSSYGVIANDGTYKQYFTADSDTYVLPEKILARGLAFKWKHAKGLPYQLDEEQFWNMLNNAIARDKAPGPASLEGPYCREPRSMVVVPLWNTVP